MAVKHTHTHSRQRERERKSAIIPSSVVILTHFLLFLLLRKANNGGFSFVFLSRWDVHSSLPLSLDHRLDRLMLKRSSCLFGLISLSFYVSTTTMSFFFAISSSKNGRFFTSRRMLDGRSDCLQVTHMSNCGCGCAS